MVQNRYVLNLHSDVNKARDDVTSGGRLFHILVVAMGNARSATTHWYRSRTQSHSRHESVYTGLPEGSFLAATGMPSNKIQHSDPSPFLHSP